MIFCDNFRLRVVLLSEAPETDRKGVKNMTEKELENLPLSAFMITFEQGIRFLTDYLEGDVYFKIHRNGHNLDRARNQFALFADMEQKREKMDAIIRDIAQAAKSK